MIGRRELATAALPAAIFAAAIFASLAVLVCVGTKANAAQCGSGPAGFEAWKREFAEEARAKGIGAAGIAALMQANYAAATIAADRGQRSFGLSLEQFLAKRGAAAIVARGRSLKHSQAALFASIQQRYGWCPARTADRHLGHGDRFRQPARQSEHAVVDRHARPADRRRPEILHRPALLRALRLIDRGMLSPGARGSMHGEVGQTQFMPKNILAYGTGNLDVRRQRAEFDRELPEGSWLAARCGVPSPATDYRISRLSRPGTRPRFYQRAIVLMWAVRIDGGE